MKVRSFISRSHIGCEAGKGASSPMLGPSSISTSSRPSLASSSSRRPTEAPGRRCQSSRSLLVGSAYFSSCWISKYSKSIASASTVQSAATGARTFRKSDRRRRTRTLSAARGREDMEAAGSADPARGTPSAMAGCRGSRRAVESRRGPVLPPSPSAAPPTWSRPAGLFPRSTALPYNLEPQYKCGGGGPPITAFEISGGGWGCGDPEPAF